MRRRTKDPKDRQGYNLGARYLVFLVITLGMFAYLLTGVFRLQVVESETYVDSAESSRTTTITLRPGSHTLDFHADMGWHERERFLKVDLPLGIVADQATYDCQYGLVRRPIVKNTASDEAKYESSTNSFAIIGDAG